MKSWIFVLLVTFIPVLAVSPGIQTGLVGGHDLSAYAGGHLVFPDLFTQNLYLHLPINLYFGNSLDSISISAHARYYFTGVPGFNLGGGLGLFSPLNSDNNDLHLGMEAIGGYTFKTSAVAITPEVTLRVFDDVGFLAGCAFTF